ncbi:MAG: O-antigen ligase family protein, partial [Thermomicrobiales bacterium]
LWMWLGTLLISTPDQLRTAVACWVGGMALSGGLAMIQANGIGTFWSAAATHNRFTGGADHPNDLGAQSAITMVPALYLLLTAKRPALRVAALAGIGCLALGLLLSGSVTALVTAVACLLLWFVAQAKLSLRGVVVVVVAAVLAIGLLQLAETMNVSTPLDRFSSATDSSGSYCTSCQRVDNNTRALEEVIAQPVIGHGLDAAGSKVDGGVQVHFMLLKAWFEAGILGLIGLAIVLLAFGAAAIQNLYNARSHDESRLALALMVAFVAFLLFGLSQPLLYQRYAWLPGAMILILRAQQVITTRSSVQINPARSQPALGVMRRPGFAEAGTGPTA